MSSGVTDFLAGGGEMGERMRTFDWASSSLGPAPEWPQSLKTIVRVMLDSRFAMWMAWGGEGTFFCNDAYLPTVGLKRDWVLGARADRVWQEIWHDIGPRIAQVLSTGQATWDAGLLLFLRRNGYDEETFHTFSYSPVYDEASRVAGMLCVVVEDTERVIGERRLRLLQALAARSTAAASSIEAAGLMMLETLKSGVFDVPFAALYLAQQGAASPGARLVGATATARRGEIPSLCRVADPGFPVVAAIANGTDQIADRLADRIGLDSPWGEPLQQALVVPLIGAAQATPFGSLVLGVSTRRPLDDGYRSFLDLVARQFASQLADTDIRLQAEQRAAALAELDRAKNLFFSNVSHEFRTPLTLMVGPIDNLLGRADLTAELRDELELVRQNGIRLRRLVNSLLDFSRIEAGRADGTYRPTDLAALTAGLASVFRSAVEDAGLRLRVRCDPMPQTAYVDRDHWEKVVLNLLSNALKFTFQGEIDVTLSFVAGHAELVVRDTGVGIEASALPSIFDRFYRIEGVRSRSQEGTGIGLALVKELVKLHGGAVSVASEVGVGTAFTVRMPLGKTHLPPERIDESPGRDGPSADHVGFIDDALRGQRASYRTAVIARGSGPAGRQRILVVDDNADMRAYIQRLLEPNWDVSIATDGLDALATIDAAPPDLVVSDMMMPRLDGRGLIERIRANPATRSVPVIVLSAQAGEEARVSGLTLGADDYLVKPFSTAELLARIEVQLMRASMRRAEDLTNKRLADIFRNAPVGVAVLRGATHVFEFTNPSYQQFIGDRAVLGLPVRQALPELDGQGIVEMLDRVRRTAEVYRGHAFPTRLLDPASGRLVVRYFEFVLQPLLENDGSVSGIAVISIDVDEMMKARTDAEQASRAKDEFIAMLGHELRNPLAPILTALQVMGMRDATALEKERLIIARQVKHMARLVDDLLDVSRISRGNVELKKTVVELSFIVDKALEMAGPLMETKRQTLDVDVARSGIPVLVDPVRLAQVIGNVLTNAAKFTGIGGHIGLRGRVEQEQAVLAIHDTGIGMSATELESVFELFAQGNQGLNRAEGGLGLGLSIARNLAHLHGGSLSAASGGLGKGSEFTLCLPLAQPASVSGLDDGDFPIAATSMEPRRRVLVVDDNCDAATVLGDLLALNGHDVVLAEDGPSALRAVDNGPAFDVVLLDIGLPVMSGYELAQHLRGRADGDAMRLVALTGYGLASDVEQARSSGFDLHLVKPVDPEILLRAIAAAGRNGDAHPG